MSNAVRDVIAEHEQHVEKVNGAIKWFVIMVLFWGILFTIAMQNWPVDDHDKARGKGSIDGKIGHSVEFKR